MDSGLTSEVSRHAIQALNADLEAEMARLPRLAQRAQEALASCEAQARDIDSRRRYRRAQTDLKAYVSSVPALARAALDMSGEFRNARLEDDLEAFRKLLDRVDPERLARHPRFHECETLLDQLNAAPLAAQQQVVGAFYSVQSLAGLFNAVLRAALGEEEATSSVAAAALVAAQGLAEEALSKLVLFYPVWKTALDVVRTLRDRAQFKGKVDLGDSVRMLALAEALEALVRMSELVGGNLARMRADLSLDIADAKSANAELSGVLKASGMH
jgi:hypothetical protein